MQGRRVVRLMTPSELMDQLAEENPDALTWDGFDEALIGIVHRACHPALALYSVPKCIDILCKRDGMTENEAEEYLEFNTLCAYMGEMTPVYTYEEKP
jgi:hypothetical protein